MLEITTINGKLKNKEFGKDIAAINRAIIAVGKNTWEVADRIAKIMREESFKEDYNTDTAFAQAIGLKKSYLSRLKRASEIHAYEFEYIPTDDDGFAKENDNGEIDSYMVCPFAEFSLSKVMEFVAYEPQEAHQILSIWDINPTDTVASIREAISCYKDDNAKITTITSDDKPEVVEASDDKPEVVEASSDKQDNAKIAGYTKKELATMKKDFDKAKKLNAGVLATKLFEIILADGKDYLVADAMADIRTIIDNGGNM